MTVEANDRRKEYAGNDVTTVFDGPRCASVSQIQVYFVVGSVASLQSTGFTVTRFRSGISRVTFSAAPPSGVLVRILRVVPFTQEYDITNQSAFLPETIEQALDGCVYQVQQIVDDLAISGGIVIGGGGSASDAASVSIVDAGGYFSGSNVELALQEAGAATTGKASKTAAFVVTTADPNLPGARTLVAGANISIVDGGAGGNLTITASTGGGSSAAADVAITDAGGYYDSTNVEAALQEVAQERAPVAASYLTVSAEAGLPNERRLVAGSGVSITDGGAGGTLTISSTSSGGTVTSVAATGGTGLSVSGSPITTAGTLALSLSANLQSWSGIAPATKTDVSSLSASSGSTLVGFTRTGTGAVTRTIESRLRDWISVKDYGAVGDGVTDDRTAIVNADAAAFAANKTLFFPSGTYMVGSHIYGLKASWQGEVGSIVKATSGLTLNLEAMLTWTSVDDISIRDMAFDLQSRPVTSGAEGVINLTNCGGFEIANCRVLNLTGSGIAINGGQRFRIVGNFISKATAATTYNQAILVSSSSRDSLEGRIFDNRCYRSAMNLHMIDGWVCRNYISEWGFGAGITTEQGSSNSLRYRIIDNVIENSGTAIDVNGYRPGGVENWGYYSVIAGNHIANCAGAGIDQGGLYTTVRDNTILNNGTSGSDNTPGPQTAGGDGISIRYGNATYNGSYSVVCNNFIADQRASGDKLQGYGLSMQSASVVGVHMYGNRYDGNWLGDENLLGTNGWFARPVASGNFKVSTSGSGSYEFTCPVIFSGSVTFSTINATEISVTSGNRVKLQGSGNLTGIRWSSPNVEIFAGSSVAASFGVNTTGFNGAAPVAKPTITGSRGANAALASLLTALASMGLITDSTT